jgi:hypothetical protein
MASQQLFSTFALNFDDSVLLDARALSPSPSGIPPTGNYFDHPNSTADVKLALRSMSKVLSGKIPLATPLDEQYLTESTRTKLGPLYVRCRQVTESSTYRPASQQQLRFKIGYDSNYFASLQNLQGARIKTTYSDLTDALPDITNDIGFTAYTCSAMIQHVTSDVNGLIRSISIDCKGSSVVAFITWSWHTLGTQSVTEFAWKGELKTIEDFNYLFAVVLAYSGLSGYGPASKFGQNPDWKMLFARADKLLPMIVKVCNSTTRQQLLKV